MGILKLSPLIPEPVRAVIREKPALAEKLANSAVDFDIILDGLLHRRAISLRNGIPTLLMHPEKEYLFKLAETTNHGGSIVEIGCYAGGSAYFLGRGAEISGIHVYCVDPFASFKERQDKEYGRPDYFPKKPSRQEVEDALVKCGLEQTVTLIEGFSQDVSKQWTNGKVSLLWIDGNHTQAAQDFYAWKPHLAPEALIVFHDVTTREEVARDLDEIVKKENMKIVATVDSIVTISSN